MAPRPRWWHILDVAKRQALTAIDFYNRSGDKRSFYDFVVHMNLAWQYLLHADLEKSGVKYEYRDKKTGRVVKVDGQPKTWSLSDCLADRFADNDPVRVNVEFFVGLRNIIEHRHQDAFLVATAGRAHAYVINFEDELVARFGTEHSLAHQLRFPVFLQSLTPAGVAEQLKLQRKLPKAASSYITEFTAALDPAVAASERFDYRVLLTPMKGPKSEADMAVTFLPAAEVTEEQRAQLVKDGKAGSVIIAEKQRDVMHKDELRPGDARALIEAGLPFVFNMWHFTEIVKHFKVKPQNGEPPEKCDTRYCLYDKPWKSYVYTRAFVKRCINEVDTRENFRAVFGKDPVHKVSKIADPPRRRKIARTSATTVRSAGASDSSAS